MSTWSGFEDSDGVLSSFNPDLDVSYRGDIESQIGTDPPAYHDIPRVTDDPDFCGLEFNTYHCCFHGYLPRRKVAFDMAATGRRFLGCPVEGIDICRFVVWIDDPWDPVLIRALIEVWRLVGSLHTNHLRQGIARTLNDKVFHDMSKEEVSAGMATESAEIGAPKTISLLRAFDSGTITIPTKIFMAALSTVTFTTIVLMLIT